MAAFSFLALETQLHGDADHPTRADLGIDRGCVMVDEGVVALVEQVLREGHDLPTALPMACGREPHPDTDAVPEATPDRPFRLRNLVMRLLPKRLLAPYFHKDIETEALLAKIKAGS